jgi:FG-GAP-like repeat/Secretion system C-terminal sorting domain
MKTNYQKLISSILISLIIILDFNLSAQTLSTLICNPGNPIVATKINLNSDKPGWTMFFSDEFTGTSISAKWYQRDGEAGTYGANPFYYFVNNSNNMFVSNGTLKLKTLYAPGQYLHKADNIYRHYDYTSAWLSSIPNNVFGPGYYYEIRCKLPKGKLHHTGMWTWTCSNNSVLWSEVDFYENGDCSLAELRKIGTNSHTSVNPVCDLNVTDNGCDIEISQNLPNVNSEWYTVGCEWTTTGLKWFINNSFAKLQTVDIPQTPGELNLATFLTYFGGSDPIKQANFLNEAANMDANGEFPGTFEVDYVRVYQKNCAVVPTVTDYTIQQGFNNNEDRPRIMGDVNGDGNDDIVAFGWNYTLVSISNGDGTFGSPQYTLQNFTKEQNYTNNSTRPRFLADVNKDGKMDIIGFGINNTYVSISNSTGSIAAFSSPIVVVNNNYTVEQGWINQSIRPRMIADVNADGKPDIIGFGYNYTVVSLNTTPNGSMTPSFRPTVDYVTQNYTLEQSYTNMETMPRMMADVNGDKKADIVAFSANHVFVSLNTSTTNTAITPNVVTVSYAAPIIAYQFNFTTGYGQYNNQEERPRILADVNGDGKADIVAFGYLNTFVAISDFPATNKFKLVNNVLTNYTKEQGWSSQNAYPRFVKDINNDGKADIIGFAGGEVKVSLNKTVSATSTPTFDEIQNTEFDFCNAQGWLDQNQYPRYLALVNNDCKPDIIGFGLNKVYTFNCLSAGACGPIGTRQILNNNFASESDYEIKIIDNTKIEFTSINSDETKKNIIMYDVSGRLIFELKNIITNDIDISNYRNGVYILKITNENNKTQVKKIMVNR